jgi:hypothetical protein
MRIVCISDTHSRHDHMEVPPGDVLIHAGDSTMLGRVEEVAKFNPWPGGLPRPHKVVIAGNHDWLLETEPALAESLITNAHYLRDNSEMKGRKFYASSWRPRFMQWAFPPGRRYGSIRGWRVATLVVTGLQSPSEALPTPVCLGTAHRSCFTPFTFMRS